MPEQHNSGAGESKVNTFRNAALAYARDGWPVFPCNPLDKRPLTKHGFKDASDNPDMINEWWNRWPNAMIGVPMGAISGVFCLDLDKKDGVDGVQTFGGLMEIYGASPYTRRHKTPSTGMHQIFRYVDGVRSIPLGKLGPGLEVKGDGGYIIVPPSKMADGKEYVGNDADFADAPPWLLDMIFNYLGRDHDLEAMLNADAGKGISKEEAIDYGPTDEDKVREALSWIPSDDYEIWYKIAGAIRKELGEAGYHIFEEWSRKSKKFNLKECRRKWRGTANMTEIKAGTIFHLAKEYKPDWFAIYNEKKQEKERNFFKSQEDALRLENKKHEKKQEENKQQKKTDDQQSKAKPEAEKIVSDLIQDNKNFISGYKPPSYIVRGVLQKRFVYSLTGMTGSGKTCVTLRLAAHVVNGLELCGRNVKQGTVLYFAGENPDDVRVRWIKLCEEMKIAPDTKRMHWMPSVPPLKNVEIKKQIYAAAKEIGQISLLIIDTSAAYFQGDDENSNVQLGEHARLMRSFVHLPGNPTVLVTCHPTKNPDITNLLPRGGGAFLNEVDGNLSCVREHNLIEIDTHGKFRGPEFAPLMFKLQPCKLNDLKDEDGEAVWSVITVPITDAEHTAIQDTMEQRRDELINAMFKKPMLSLSDYAEELGWTTQDGKPNKRLVQRLMDKLVLDRMVEKKGGHWSLNKKMMNEMGRQKAEDSVKEKGQGSLI